MEQDLTLIQPNVAVALGATAARALVGKPVSITKLRGSTVESAEGVPVLITVHPSYLLRIPNAVDQEAERRRFAEDMRKVKALMKE